MNTATALPKLPDFEYSALPDDSEYIRLFEVLAESAGPYSVTYSLTTWKVDNAPSYHAISYTWGDADVTETICLNNRTKTVSKNCADVLRQIQHFKTSRYYWTDAICIDQSNVAEKSHQVASMGYVFERAEHVLACLGTDDAECEYAMTMIEKIERHFVHSGDSPTQASQLDEDRFFKPSNALLSRVPGMDIIRFSFSILELARRPYFFRVWVLQELLLAKNISFCFGNYIQPKHVIQWHFYHISGIHFAIQSRHDIKIPDPHTLDPSEYPQSLVNAVTAYGEDLPSFIPTLVLFDSGRPGSSSMSSTLSGRNRADPFQLVSLCSERFCHDPRDTIYGTLALTKWNDEDPIAPDYRKSNFCLAVEYLKFLSYEDDARSLLGNLKLDRDNASLKAAAASRKVSAPEADHSACCSHGPDDRRRIKCMFRGKKLHEIPSDEQFHHPEEQDYVDPMQPAQSSQSEMKTFLPNGVHPEDFIVWSDENYGPEALILRTVPPSHFAIIGRAWMQQDKDTFYAHFKVIFDAEDFTIYGATSKGPSHEELMLHVHARMGMYDGPLPAEKLVPDEQDLYYLDVPVCRERLSSYAVRGPDIEPTDYVALKKLVEENARELVEESKRDAKTLPD